MQSSLYLIEFGLKITNSLIFFLNTQLMVYLVFTKIFNRFFQYIYFYKVNLGYPYNSWNMLKLALNTNAISLVLYYNFSIHPIITPCIILYLKMKRQFCLLFLASFFFHKFFSSDIWKKKKCINRYIMYMKKKNNL